MKIGILTDVLNEHSGARVSVKLGEALAKRDQAEVVFFATGQLLSPETYKRITEKHKVKIFKKPIIISLELISFLKEEKLDVISAHCSLRILFSAYLSGVKIFRTDYGTQFPSLNGDYGGWRVSLGKKLIFFVADVYVFIRDYLKFYFCHRSLAISGDQAQKIKRLYGKKVDYIYLGADDFDPPKFYPGQRHDSKIRILSVSRFVPYKGFHILIDAFKSLEKDNNELELVLVGGQSDTVYSEFLKRLAGETPNIRFIADPSDDVLAELFRSSQIYASGTRWEAFGLPFLEASFFGLPTLGFASFGPATEVVRDGVTGFLVANEGEFKEKLRRLVLNSSLREDLGQRGRELSENFTWEKTAKGYLNLFREVVH